MPSVKLIVAAAALGAIAPLAQAASYTELFPNSAQADQGATLRAVGWCGGNAGDPFCANRAGDPNADNDGGEGAVSVSNGEDGDRGFAFWSQTSIGADGFLYTDEFQFQTSEFQSLSWHQRDSEPSQATRLAFQIGSDWYVSATGDLSTSSSTWEEFSVTDLLALSFVKYDGGGDASTLPGGNAASGAAAALPDGFVSAWGFAWDGAKSGTSRIDTVSLDVAPIPLPPAAMLMIAGIGALGAIGRRRSAARA